jgi:hypothetical protein
MTETYIVYKHISIILTSPSTRAHTRVRILRDITINYCLMHLMNKELLILSLCFCLCLFSNIIDTHSLYLIIINLLIYFFARD